VQHSVEKTIEKGLQQGLGSLMNAARERIGELILYLLG
jgi:hypothetical protein